MKAVISAMAVVLMFVAPSPGRSAERCDAIPDAGARLECYREQTCEAGEDELPCYRKIIVEMNKALSDDASIDQSAAPAVAPVGSGSSSVAGTVATEPLASPKAESEEAEEATQPSVSTRARSDDEQVVPEEALDAFGLQDGLVLALSGSESSLDAIEAKIVRVLNPGGIRTVLLDNGQVWRENERSRLRLFDGQRVVISRRTFAYSLKAERGGSGKVHRVNCESAENRDTEVCRAAIANLD